MLIYIVYPAVFKIPRGKNQQYNTEPFTELGIIMIIFNGGWRRSWGAVCMHATYTVQVSENQQSWLYYSEYSKIL